jgi:glc operon protein GlcG
MTSCVRTTRQLTYDGAALAIAAGVAKAREIGVPQNISIVDAGGNLLAFARMDDARFLAQHSSFSKAQTAASLHMATGGFPSPFGVDLALATGGRSINMAGGLPIVQNGEVLGAVGVSSGEDAQDLAVAQAACDAVLAALAS